MNRCMYGRQRLSTGTSSTAWTDHQTEAALEDNTLHLLATKNVSYRHKNGVRIIMSWPVRQDFRDVVGIYVPIDLSALIDSVAVSPRALPWFREVVEDATRTYGLAAKLEASVLFAPIIYSLGGMGDVLASREIFNTVARRMQRSPP